MNDSSRTEDGVKIHLLIVHGIKSDQIAIAT